MLNEIFTGPQNVGDSFKITQRGGKQGDAMVSELHGAYYEQTYRGRRFTASTQALVTTTLGLATTYTGLVISNTPNSGINASIDFASMMQSVLQSTQVEAFAIATGFNATTAVTHTTPVATRNCMVGSSISSAVFADVSATLPTAPFYHRFFTNTGTATADSTGVQIAEIKGSIILPPGGYALFVTPAQASVAGMWFSFDWEESPI